MSKESAMSMLTGQPAPAVNPSLITGEAPKPDNSPGLMAVPDEPVTAPPSNDIDSDRFARIAAKEAKFQKEREQFKSEQQKLYEEKRALSEIKTKIDSFEQLKKQDPVAALKELGFSENDIFNFMASKENEEPSPEQKAAKAAQEEIQKWKDEQAAKEAQTMAERDSKALQAFKGEIGNVIAKEKDKYEYCAHYGPVAEDTIFKTVVAFMQDDQDLSPTAALKEAIEAVESLYEKDDEALQSIKKRNKTPMVPEAPTAAAPAQRTRVPEAKPAPQVPTLTNRTSATVSSSIKGAKETPEQKRSRLEHWLRTGVNTKS